ncbi:MAG TPA: hypothetical protein VF320_05760, partial [Acidimicrobiales bacterium]
LEGMVFGARLAETILAGGDGPTPSGVLAPVLDGRTVPVARPAPPRPDPTLPGGSADGPGLGSGLDVAKARDQLQRAMTDGAGVVRSAGSLARAGETVAAVAEAIERSAPSDRARGELANLVTAATSVLASATLRTETRGAHARSDFPHLSDAWRCRIVDGGPAGTTVLAGTPTEPTGPDGPVRP